MSEAGGPVTARTSGPWSLAFTNLGKLDKVSTKEKTIFGGKYFFQLSLITAFLPLNPNILPKRNLLLFINGNIQKE